MIYLHETDNTQALMTITKSHTKGQAHETKRIH